LERHAKVCVPGGYFDRHRVKREGVEENKPSSATGTTEKSSTSIESTPLGSIDNKGKTTNGSTKNDINASSRSIENNAKKDRQFNEPSMSYNEKAAASANDSSLYPCDICQRTVMFG
jgi:hypothetical protein